jgi:hypothetical protein
MKQLSKSKDRPKLKTKKQSKPNSPIKTKADDKLINIANQYISEDSLEKFQKTVQDKYKRLNNIKVQYFNDINENLKTKLQAEKIFTNIDIPIKPKKPVNIKPLPRNVQTALEYYNMIES